MQVFVVHAQQREDIRVHEVMSEIDRAYYNGSLSIDQKVLYKFYAGLKPERLPAEFRLQKPQIIKCGTPAYIEFNKYRAQLSPETVAEIKSLTSQSNIQADKVYESPSGKFKVHYYTAGDSAVASTDTGGVSGVPDYVERVAEAADSSYRHEVNNLGYGNPIPAGQFYDIEIVNFDFYGQTISTNGSTFIQIHNNFIDFPPNTDPEGDVIGAIKVTMAHELKHAIQFVTNNWSGETDLWAEMDATLMEEVVYDNVNDYYNYLVNSSSIFQNPQNSFYPGSYYHVTWALYFEQKYGPAFWPDVWKRIENDPSGLRFTKAIQNEIGSEDSFQHDFIESYLWHLASGPTLSADNYGFEERLEYPDAKINSTVFNKTKLDSLSLMRFSANFFQVNSDQSPGDLVQINFTRTDTASNQEIGIGVFTTINGSFDYQIIRIGDRKSFTYQTPYLWEDFEQVNIVVANGSEKNTPQSQYTIEFTSTEIPETITLSQNYPNPFRPGSQGTAIPFTLNGTSRVRIKVYDVTGRLVATLIDEERSAGSYDDVRFDGSSLASGIYFYQLVTDQKVLSKKMTLIK